jgi:hypothetical protein
MHNGFGAWIECDSADTKLRVGNALAGFGGSDKMIRLFCNDNGGKHTITRAQEIA